MPSEQTIKSALKALEGMETIVSIEALVKGHYVQPDPEQTNSVCNGARYCAIGSLWAGAGIKARERKMFGSPYWDLPGSEEHDRDTFLRHRPGLKLAYEHLNQAAERYIEEHGLAPDTDDEYHHSDAWDFHSMLEGLFEQVADVGRDDLLEVIQMARESIAAEVGVAA